MSGALLTELGFERVARPADAWVQPLGREGFRYESRRPAMTTLVSVTAIHPSAGAAALAVARAFEEMDRLIAIFNRYDAASALSVLNAEGCLVGPPPELELVVSAAVAYHRLSDGAFDPTVAPLVDLFRRCLEARSPREPTAAELAEARERVGADGITATRQRLRLARDGMTLTLDGIAKGFIVDRMCAALEQAGVSRYLVEAGGDIRTGGHKEAGRPWSVAVRDPDGTGCLPGSIALTGGAVATSGSYERYFDPVRYYHHIVEPLTGQSPHAAVSATVIAPTATAADALATAAFVLGAAAGVALVDRLPGCACLVIAADGGRHQSSRWKESS